MDLQKLFEDVKHNMLALFTAALTTVHGYIQTLKGTITTSKNVAKLAAAFLVRAYKDGEKFGKNKFYAALRLTYRATLDQWTVKPIEIVHLKPAAELAKEEKSRKAKQKPRYKAMSYYEIAQSRVDMKVLKGELKLVMDTDAYKLRVMNDAVRLASGDPDILKWVYPVRLAGKIGTTFFIRADTAYNQAITTGLLEEMWWVDMPVDQRFELVKQAWKKAAREACAIALVLTLMNEEQGDDVKSLFDTADSESLEGDPDTDEANMQDIRVLSETIKEKDEFDVENEGEGPEEIDPEINQELKLFDREHGFDGRLGALLNAKGGKFARTLEAEDAGRPFDGGDADDVYAPTKLYKVKPEGDWKTYLLNKEEMVIQGYARKGHPEDLEQYNFEWYDPSAFQLDPTKQSLNQLKAAMETVEGSDVQFIFSLSTKELVADTKDWKITGNGIKEESLHNAIKRFVASTEILPPSVCKFGPKITEHPVYKGWQLGRQFQAEEFGTVCLGFYQGRVYLITRLGESKAQKSERCAILREKIRATGRRVSLDRWNELVAHGAPYMSPAHWMFPGHKGEVVGMCLRGELEQYILRHAGFEIRWIKQPKGKKPKMLLIAQGPAGVKRLLGDRARPHLEQKLDG